MFVCVCGCFLHSILHMLHIIPLSYFLLANIVILNHSPSKQSTPHCAPGRGESPGWGHKTESPAIDNFCDLNLNVFSSGAWVSSRTLRIEASKASAGSSICTARGTPGWVIQETRAQIRTESLCHMPFINLYTYLRISSSSWHISLCLLQLQGLVMPARSSLLRFLRSLPADKPQLTLPSGIQHQVWVWRCLNSSLSEFKLLCWMSVSQSKVNPCTALRRLGFSSSPQ